MAALVGAMSENQGGRVGWGFITESWGLARSVDLFQVQFEQFSGGEQLKKICVLRG